MKTLLAQTLTYSVVILLIAGAAYLAMAPNALAQSFIIVSPEEETNTGTGLGIGRK